MRNFLYACIFLAVFVSCSAYAETLTLRTYYPVPFGNYERLRLVPRSNLSGACPIGTMYVESPDVMKFCSDDGSGSGTWGALGGVWKQSALFDRDGDGVDDVDVILTSFNAASPSDPDLFVGIGTTNPSAKLTVVDGAVLFSGTTGGTPVFGTGTRMMWLPGKRGAFRAGETGPTQWDDINIGDVSVAMGSITTASGGSAFAMGWQSIASGDYSTAMGMQVTASGVASTSIGSSTDASGSRSVALGGGATASGITSAAMGAGPTASGMQSIALGTSTTASGDRSTAMGDRTIASGAQSTAVGHTTIASGNMSTSMGYFTTASGVQSTAMGTGTIADGWTATSMGRYTTASSFSSLTIGSYNVDLGGNTANWVLTDPLFIIGNGADAANLSNAMTVLKNGRVGIGVVSPDTVLHVQTADNTPLFKITSNSSAEMIFQSQNNTNNQIQLSTMDGNFFVSDYRTGSWTSDLRVLGSTGDIYIPKINSALIMKSPDGSCSACGPDNSDVWTCTSRACP